MHHHRTPCRPAWLILLAALALSACASVPDYAQPAASTAPPRIIGSRGPLTAEQSKALLARLGTEPGDAGLLQRHLAIEQAVAESPLLIGNRTHVLRDGPATFRAMFAAIKSARHQINLEYFIIEDVESDGVRLADLLVEKRRDGVAVNLIYDSYGAQDTPSVFFTRLSQAGVTILEFNPINPLDIRAGYTPNGRDHRKLLVVDGTLAIVGGVNLSASYESNPLAAAPPPGSLAGKWRDTDLLISGPAVATLQTLFLEHWRSQKGPPLDDAAFFPPIPIAGNSLVRIIGSTPDHAVPRYYVTLLSSIRNAEKRVFISAAYFVPTHQEMEDLTHAARRGVDVRLLLGNQSDSALALTVARSRYSDLLEAGVKIYETRGVVLHSKTVVIDGVWSTIGSSNFDQRSVLYNDEVDAVVLGSEMAQEIEAMFAEDLLTADQIDLITWESRPLLPQLQGVFLRTWQSML